MAQTGRRKRPEWPLKTAVCTCAAFQGVIKLQQSDDIKKYLKENNLTDKMQDAVHIAWATGGSLVPENIREEYKKTYLA